MVANTIGWYGFKEASFIQFNTSLLTHTHHIFGHRSSTLSSCFVRRYTSSFPPFGSHSSSSCMRGC